MPRAPASGRCATPSSIFSPPQRTGGDRSRAPPLSRGLEHDRCHRRALNPLGISSPRRGSRRFLPTMGGRAARPRQMVHAAGESNASRTRSRTLQGLLSHPKFSLKNPNRVRALIGSFVNGNPTGFNRADGAGYEFLASSALQIDRFNPHMAARLLGAFESWRTLEPGAKLWPRAPCGSSHRANCPQTATKSSQRPSAPTDSRIRQSVVNYFSTIFPWTFCDSNPFNRERFGDAAVLRLDCGEPPIKGDRMSRINSAQQPLFAIAAPIWRGPSRERRPLSAQDRVAPAHASRSHRHLRLTRRHRPRRPDLQSRQSAFSSPKSVLRSWPT